MSLNITNIKIENVRPGSKAQRKVGILGVFTLDFYLEGGTFFLTLKDMSLRETREGKRYIQHPFEVWGDEKKKKYHHYLWPTSNNRDEKMKDLLKKVEEQIGPIPSEEKAASSSGSMLGDDLF